MTKVELICAQKPHKGEEWNLTATAEGLLLTDHLGETITLVPNAETPLRIKFPSFWASIAHLVVIDDAGQMLYFEPIKKTLASVKELVSQCQGQAGSAAVTAVQHTAVRDIVIGVCLFIIGVGLTIGSFVMAKPGGTFFITTGLLACGVLGLIKGFYGLNMARRIEQSLAEEDGIEEVAGE